MGEACWDGIREGREGKLHVWPLYGEGEGRDRWMYR